MGEQKLLFPSSQRKQIFVGHLWVLLHIERDELRGMSWDSARCRNVPEIRSKGVTQPESKALVLITAPILPEKQQKVQIKPPGKAQGQWNNSLTLLKLYKMPIFIYRLKCLTIPQCRLMINQCPANQSIEFRSNQHLTGFIRATEGEGFKKKIKIKLNGSNVPLYYRQIINTLQRKSGGKIIKMQSFSGYMVWNMKKKQEVRVWR